MDRPVIYSTEQGRSTDFLFGMRCAMVGMAKLSEAMFGTSAVVAGLAATPTAPAGLTVNIAPGQIYSLAAVDATAYGALSADTVDQVVKQGLLMATQNVSCPAPVTGGQSINYLIQATYQDQDLNNVVLPYYNSANPSQPLSGQSNSGAAQATERHGVCVVSVKAGAAATTGTQTTPAPDAGNVGLYVVTVANGQSTITSGNISQYSGAPLLPAAGLVVGGLQGHACIVAPAGGSADAIFATFVPAITSLTNGMTLMVRAASANATTTPTFTPAGSISAKTIVKGNGLALAVGDIAGAGHWIELQYDLALDKWVLKNPAYGVQSVASQFAQSIAANGYVKLPNGIIIQWGTFSAGSTGTVFTNTFPLTWPTGAFVITPVHLGTDPTVNIIVDATTPPTTTQFGLRGNNASNVSVYVIAIGR